MFECLEPITGDGVHLGFSHWCGVSPATRLAFLLCAVLECRAVHDCLALGSN